MPDVHCWPGTELLIPSLRAVAVFMGSIVQRKDLASNIFGEMPGFSIDKFYIWWIAHYNYDAIVGLIV